MKTVYRIDINGFYIEDVVLQDNDEIPEDCVDLAPPNGLFKGEFVYGEWVEGLTQDEVDAIKNAPLPKSDIGILKENQALMQQALDDLILGGAL